MPLEAYRKRRDFAATPEPEPEGGKRRRSGAPVFAVQKHGARRLHYDLRLEHGGVLWSWAVTRGPSTDPGEKRLAVRTEDHPLDYAGFEGVIPRGQYGAGPVALWDRGTWEAEGDPAKAEAKGHLALILHGERLKGRWHLVRMAARRGDRGENWLLIKVDDAHADATDTLARHTTSILSGRTLEEIAAGTAPARRTRRPGPPPEAAPGFVQPALATLGDAAPSGPRWLHEIKFDGYRIQAHIGPGGARLLTRSGQDWTQRFGPGLAHALGSVPGVAILDGEAVVEDAGGVSDFSALQAALADGPTGGIVYYAFDLLHADGADLRPLPLIERKERLAALLDAVPSDARAILRHSAHFEEEGEVMLRHACRLSLEGLVSKRRDEPYRSGRTKGWIKSKCLDRREFVILGYAPSAAQDDAIGALLLGQHGAAGWEPVGRVGTGFTRRAAADLFARLQPLRRDDPAWQGRVDAVTRREIRFTEPALVAEVAFLSRTRDGTLRHASFRGLREDKPPEEVTEEAAAPRPFAEAAARPPDFARLTNPGRVYWPEAGVTKEALADHYLAVWRLMAPHIARRPLALVRCPNGYTAHCFFQKHLWKGASRHILRLDDPLDDDDDPSMIAVDGLPGLGGVVQAGTLEIHTWQSTADDLERPDQIVMDLDPGEGVTREALVAAAIEVRERLAQAGLAAFVKTTGGKGYHVVAPLAPHAGWDAVKAFAKGVADAMAADDADAYVATISKAKRRGRILIDYLRNGRGATAVAPYSTRARTGAPVSVPITWEELTPALDPAHWTVPTLPARLDALEADPWAGFRDAAAPLPEPDAPRRRRTRAA